MKKAHRGYTDFSAYDYASALTMTAAAFILGAVIGCLLAARSGGQSAMADYLYGYVVMAQSNKPDFISALAAVLRFPFLVFLCGFIVYGRFFIPPLLAVRGLLLGFTSASFYILFGLNGLLIAAAILGPGCVFSIPALFGLSVKAVANGREFTASKNGFFSDNKDFLIFSLICLLVLAVGTAAEVAVSPPLIERVIGRYYSGN